MNIMLKKCTLLAAAAIAGLAVLSSVAACSDPPSEDVDGYCTVQELPDGTVHIECPDTSADIEPCFATLPDLDGNGAVDAEDCRLSGAGEVLRALCDAPEAWATIPSCRATLVSNVSNSFWPPAGAVSTLTSGQLSLAYAGGDGVKLWRDADSDGAVGSGETQTLIAAQPSRLNELRFTADRMGCATLAVRSFDDQLVRYWRDLDCDGIAQAAETGSLSLASTGTILNGIDLLPWADTTILVFVEATPDFGPLRLRAWADTNRDLSAAPAEVLTIAEGPSLRYYDGSVSAGTQSVSQLWYNSGAGDIGMPDTVWTFGSTWSLAAGNGRPLSSRESACRLIQFLDYDQFICVEAGGLVTVRSPEWSLASDIPIDAATNAYDLMTNVTARDLQGTQYASIRRRNDAVLVAELDNDSAFSSDETFTREAAIIAHYVRGAPFFARNPSQNVLLTEQWFPQEETRFLGEECNATRDTCSGDLICRISGNAPEARCVPPP